MKTLWLIPARGGSKGVPNKNLKPFCGVSLVGRAVKQALECANPGDRVFVSTDSDAIKDEAIKHGAEIPFMRPAELATDTSPTHSAIVHALETFENLGEKFERVVLLQPTSPFRRSEDIIKSIELWTPEIDMVVSVTASKSNPYFNLFEEDSEGFLHVCKGGGEYSRRQDCPKVWEYNGAVYVITADSLKKGPMSKFRKVLAYEMPASRSIDIDTPEDWEMAENLYRNLGN